MGGKSTQSTSTVSIPPEVLARYNSVNARAENVAATPFQAYGGQFVAPINPTQQAGIEATSQYSQAAQPYYGAATGLALAGAMPVNPQQLQTGRYMSPYTEYVAGSTEAALRQQQGQQLSQQQTDAIRAGAFGGDRAGIQRAVLQGQQGLATAQALAPIYQQGFQQAQGVAQQQQGVNLQAQQANRQALAQAGQQVAGLGTGAQQAALQGAQAQIGAGTLAQQTQQAQDTAQYQQFLQERGYPFQVAQFLANIAMGTGALSGSTTTTTQPSSFFSDERLKENIEPIGETFDGQPIYKYNYKGEPGTQIGLMAQDVEKKHPEAVGEAAGFKTVNYDRATEEAAARGATGLMPRNWMGGAVHEPGSFARGGYALSGAVVDLTDMKAILEANRQSLAPFAQAGLYGGQQGQSPMGGKSFVPPPSLATPKGLAPAAAPRPQESGFKQMMGELQSGQNMYESLLGEKGLFGEKGVGTAIGKKLGLTGTTPPAGQNQGSGVASGTPAKAPTGGVAPQGQPKIVTSDATDRNIPPEQVGVAMPVQTAEIDPSLMSNFDSGIMGAARGGQIHRRGYAGLGKVIDPMELQDPSKGVGAYIDDATESQDENKLNAPPPPPGGSGGGGSDVSTAITLATTAAKVLPMLMSDRRLKSNIEHVGNTYDGQKIYTYNIGDGPTQMGLMAQEVMDRKPEAVGQRDGFLTLDYDRATEDAAPRYRGGVAPRPHFAAGGFESALNRTLGFEGGYAEDTGGPTMMGISSKANPDVDLERVKQDPEYRAGIYRERYWNPMDLENMDPKMQRVAFDTAVNLGVGRTKQLLEQAGDDPSKLLQLRQQHYDRLIQNDPETYGKYGKGWTNRLAALAGDIGSEAPSGGVAPQKSWALRNLPTTTTPEGKEEVNVKQLLIPGLIGLGQMAASPSRYFGAAALQGLGAGAQAYANLEKQQQDIAASKAATEKIYSDIPSNAIITDNEGRTIGVKVYVGTQLKTVPIAEFYRAQATGQPYDLSPRPGGTRAQPSEPGYSIGEAEKGAVEAPTAPSAPGTPEAPKISAPYRALPSDDQALAINNAKLVQQTGTQRLATSPSANPFDAQNAVAGRAQSDTQQRNMFAKSLGSIPRNANAVSTGQFSTAVATPIVSWVNSTLGTLGVDVKISKPSDLANAEIAKKISTQLGTMRTNESGQRAYGALERILTAIPSQANTPEGAAALLADIYQTQQREIDLNRYLNQARKVAEQKIGLNRNESRYIGDGLVDKFATRMEPQYSNEKKVLAEMYMTPFRYKDASGKTVSTYLMPYLAGNPGDLNPDLRKAIGNKYGPEILRYFTGE